MTASPSEGAHTVQFFETRPNLCAAVSQFAAAALKQGEDALLIMVPDHRRQVLHGLEERDVAVGDALASRQLVLLDAQQTLDGFMDRGIPDAERFLDCVGRLLEQRSQPGRSLKVYGEMVSVLWEAAHRHAALELEGLWNILTAAHPISLLCGYLVDNVHEFCKTPEFMQICGLHTHAGSATRKSVGVG